MLIGQMAIVVTVLGWLLFVVLTLTRSSIGGAPDRPQLDLATIGYLVIMSLLACSALAYLTTRLGYYSRTRSHRRATRVELSQPFERSAPSAHGSGPLLPGGRARDPHDVALRSAAGVSGARARPVDRRSARAALCQARRDAGGGTAAARRDRGAPGRADAAGPDGAGPVRRPLPRRRGVAGRRTSRTSPPSTSTRPRGSPATPSRYEIVDHADRFLVEQVLLGLCADLTTNAEALRAAAGEGASLSRDHLRFLLTRLTWIFGAKLTTSSASATSRCRTSPTRR